jgi:hypothetical protein
LSEAGQSLSVLKRLLLSIKAPKKKIVLNIAGNESVYNRFNNELGKIISVNSLGWLNSQKYSEVILKSSCILVVPWSLKTRQVIPSKFYELCSYNKPIWIIGNCTGSFDILLNEWGHPKILFDDLGYQEDVLNLAQDGNYIKMFNIENCLNKPLYAAGLFKEYMIQAG